MVNNSRTQYISPNIKPLKILRIGFYSSRFTKIRNILVNQCPYHLNAISVSASTSRTYRCSKWHVLIRSSNWTKTNIWSTEYSYGSWIISSDLCSIWKSCSKDETWVNFYIAVVLQPYKFPAISSTWFISWIRVERWLGITIQSLNWKNEGLIEFVDALFTEQEKNCFWSSRGVGGLL